MRATRWTYVPHALYSVAITSLSIHLVNHRKASTDETSRVTAQISILESLVQGLRSGSMMDDEVERLKRLARPMPVESDILGRKKSTQGASGKNEEETSWKDAFFGKKPSGELSKWDMKEIEELRKEFSKES